MVPLCFSVGLAPTHSIIEAAEFMYLYVTSNVYYNINTTDLSPPAIKDLVANGISTYSTNNLSDFKKPFRYSNFTSAIDNSDTSILSNDTSVQAIIAINPTLNVNNTYSLQFRNQLIIDHPLTDGELITTHKPAIKSSTFTYNGRASAFIQDDGEGKLQILRTTASGFVYLNRDIGTVDYITGKIIIRNLNISAYQGADLRIYARTLMSDITPPNNRIITIRPEDVLITVYGVAG
jgi:hypothetical protein